MLDIIFFIIGVRVIYLNWMIIDSIGSYTDLSEVLSMGYFLYGYKPIITCIILVTLLQGLKSKGYYEANFITYIKNTIKSLKNNIILSLGIIITNTLMVVILCKCEDLIFNLEGLLGFIVLLIGGVYSIISGIGVPVFMVSMSKSKTDKVFYKEREKHLEKQMEKARRESEEYLKEQRKRKEELEREREFKLKLQHERNCKRNRIIEINNNFAENIAKSVLTQTNYLSNYNNEFNNDKFYMFDNKLGITSLRPKEVWFNNDDKLKYYINAFENLNYRCNGDFKQYVDDLIKRGYTLQSRINTMSTEFSVATKLSNLNNQKLKVFKSYIDTRRKQMSLDFKSCKAGIEGEERVNRELDLHTNIINLKNIRLEVKDNNNQINSIENDNILLTRNGIFVLEVKNYGEIGNYDIIIEKDGRWLKKNRYDGTISPLNNVIKQNNRHIGFLNKFINESTNRDFDKFVEVDGIVVIANEKITIENHNQHQNIFRDSELYSYIKSQPVRFTKEELDEIEALIKVNNLPPKTYPIYDYVEEIINNITSLEIYIREHEKIVTLLEAQYSKLIEELRAI